MSFCTAFSDALVPNSTVAVSSSATGAKVPASPRIRRLKLLSVVQTGLGQ